VQVNQKKKGLLVLSFAAGIIYAGLLSFPDSMFSGSQEFTIANMDITYNKLEPRLCGLEEPTYIPVYYKIELINGEYYSNGQIIDPGLIQGLSESLTDFYESTTYTGGHPLTVYITFENGKTMVLESTPDKPCFIPWIVKYGGKFYAQYSGEISTALLGILMALDKDEWYQYDKEVRWGCYPADVPEKYSMKGISYDFPRSERARPPEVKERKCLWEIDLEKPLLEKPVYIDGHVFVLTTGYLASFEARTGEILWKVNRKKGCIAPSHSGFLVDDGAFYTVLSLSHGEFLVDDGALYTVFDCDATMWVVKVDAHSGAIVWEHEYLTVDSLYSAQFGLSIYRGNLLVCHDSTRCLDTETGEEVWEIPHAYYGELHGNKFFFRSSEQEFDYGLADIETGEIIWKMDEEYYVRYRGHYNGVLYFVSEGEDRFFSLSTESLEGWSYFYGEDVPPGYQAWLSCEVCENGIFLLIRGFSLDTWQSDYAKIVFLNETGSKVWEYTYDTESAVRFPTVENVQEVQDILYVLKLNGFMEAFSNGEKLWENEIRGSIKSSQIYGNRIYVTASDCMVYCLDGDTGDILWEMTLCDRCMTNRYYHCWCNCGTPILMSEIADGMLFVGSENTLVAVSVGLWAGVHTESFVCS